MIAEASIASGLPPEVFEGPYGADLLAVLQERSLVGRVDGMLADMQSRMRR